MAEPTNQQLARLACVLIYGSGYKPSDVDYVEDLFNKSSLLREIWLGHHAKLQKQIDEMAEER